MLDAQSANAPEVWNHLWSHARTRDWREDVLSPVYDRIAELAPLERGCRVIDLGGGVGHLGARLAERGAWVEVWDHSEDALRIARSKGMDGWLRDLQAFGGAELAMSAPDVIVCTEVLEHLGNAARETLLGNAAIKGCPCFFSVPNNRLGPDEEPQHTIKWTALDFLKLLRRFWPAARVEVMGGFLLGVCTHAAKPFKLSVCFPARDEAHDIERTLASFRGVADEIVVGIDPRSTDRTEEIARQYAEKVFILDKPQGDGDATDVHFSNIRNQCIEQCDGDWIFMTEAHEHLHQGMRELLHLESIAEYIRVLFVWRRGTGGANSIQRWMFPWLFRNHDDLRFKRAKHNILDLPDGHAPTYLPAVVTYHKRHASNAVQRQVQRKKHNRRDLFTDWLKTANENSLFYAASEERTENPDKAIRMFQHLVALPSRNGARRYQARLILAKLLAFDRKDYRGAKDALLGCPMDDWSRVDHWVFLGDLSVLEEKWDEAIAWYLYASTRIGDMPMSMWWIDESFYTWLPAQRLAECYARMNDAAKSLQWARTYKEQLEALGDAPADALDEANNNIAILEDATCNLLNN